MLVLQYLSRRGKIYRKKGGGVKANGNAKVRPIFYAWSWSDVEEIFPLLLIRQPSVGQEKKNKRKLNVIPCKHPAKNQCKILHYKKKKNEIKTNKILNYGKNS